MKNRPKIAICLPTGDECKTDFALSLAALFGTSACAGLRLELCNARKALMPASRIELVDIAINAGAGWLLFLDSDMVFPKNLLTHMLSHDRDIVVAGYCQRRPPHQFEACVAGSHKHEWRHLEYDSSRTGLERIEVAGFGVALVRASVFEKIEEPWFHLPYHPEIREERTLKQGDAVHKQAGFVSEDFYFFEKVRDAGISVWLDWDATHRIGHVGQFQFHPSHKYLSPHHFWQPIG